MRPLFWVVDTDFSLYDHWAERQQESSLIPSYKGTNLTDKGSALIHNCVPSLHLLISSHWELGFQHMNLGLGRTYIQSITSTQAEENGLSVVN